MKSRKGVREALRRSGPKSEFDRWRGAKVDVAAGRHHFEEHAFVYMDAVPLPSTMNLAFLNPTRES